jgi:hypothetical protein
LIKTHNGKENALAEAVKTAHKFMNTSEYIAHPDNLRRLEDFRVSIKKVLKKTYPDVSLSDKIDEVCGYLSMDDNEDELKDDNEDELKADEEIDLSAYVKKKEFTDIEALLWDSLYANTIAARYRLHDREPIMMAIRLTHLLRSIVELPSESSKLSALKDSLTATILLPRDLYPKSKTPTIPKRTVQDAAPESTFVQELRQLQGTLAEVREKFNEHQARLIKTTNPTEKPGDEPLQGSHSTWSTLGEKLRRGRRNAQAGPKLQEPLGQRESLSRFSASSAQQLSATTRDFVAKLGISFEPC